MNKPPIIWTNVLVFSLTALVALVGVPIYQYTVGFDTFEVVATILATGFCGMSITAGYHRLWSHKAYDAHPVLQFIFAIGGAFALQNSALHWSSDHRIHHKHVDDNDKDPYSAKKGFWYSHIGWMLREYQAHRYNDYANVKDLQRNRIVMWQHKHYLKLVLLTNIGIPALLGLIHGDMIGMLLSVGFLRLVVSHHVTFFINSLAHMWGSRPYTEANTARDNGILAFFTYGEGYHNYHHIFEYDYRNGIRWWQYDPTKWFIKACSYFGLTKNLRTSPEERIERAKAATLLQRAQESLANRNEAANKLQDLQAEYEKLLTKLNEFYATNKKLMELKKRKMLKKYNQSELAKQHQELKQLWAEQKQQWADQKREWSRFVAQYA